MLTVYAEILIGLLIADHSRISEGPYMPHGYMLSPSGQALVVDSGLTISVREWQRTNNSWAFTRPVMSYSQIGVSDSSDYVVVGGDGCSSGHFELFLLKRGAAPFNLLPLIDNALPGHSVAVPFQAPGKEEAYSPRHFFAFLNGLDVIGLIDSRNKKAIYIDCANKQIVHLPTSIQNDFEDRMKPLLSRSLAYPNAPILLQQSDVLSEFSFSPDSAALFLAILDKTGEASSKLTDQPPPHYAPWLLPKKEVLRIGWFNPVRTLISAMSLEFPKRSKWICLNDLYSARSNITDLQFDAEVPDPAEYDPLSIHIEVVSRERLKVLPFEFNDNTRVDAKRYGLVTCKLSDAPKEDLVINLTWLVRRLKSGQFIWVMYTMPVKLQNDSSKFPDGLVLRRNALNEIAVDSSN
jgi:hypothetical protein